MLINGYVLMIAIFRRWINYAIFANEALIAITGTLEKPVS